MKYRKKALSTALAVAMLLQGGVTSALAQEIREDAPQEKSVLAVLPSHYQVQPFGASRRMGIPMLNLENRAAIEIKTHSSLSHFEQCIHNYMRGNGSPSVSFGALFKLNESDGKTGNLKLTDVAFYQSLSHYINISAVYTHDKNDKAWSTYYGLKEMEENQAKLFSQLRATGQLSALMSATMTFANKSAPFVHFDGIRLGDSSLPDKGTVTMRSNWTPLSKSDPLGISMGANGFGASSITDVWLVLGDFVKPTVQSARVDGEWLYLDMGEPLCEPNVYVAQEDVYAIELVLSTEDRTTGKAAADVKAICMGKGDTDSELKFYLDYRGENEEIQLRSIKSVTYDNRIYSHVEKPLYRVDVYGAAPVEQPDKTNFMVDLKDEVYYHADAFPEYSLRSYSKSPITDIAGNPLDIRAGKNLLTYEMYVDNKAPTITKAELRGSMMTAQSETGKLPEEWPEDIDRSSVFAGVGDTLTFRLMGDEDGVNYSAGDKAVLNLQYANGTNVEVPLERTETASGGVNSRDVTWITTGPLTIKDTMTCPDGGPIRVLSIKGRLTDASQNVNYTPVFDVMPKQQIYLDVSRPVVEMQPPTGSGKAFSVPITFTDGEGVVSGSKGLIARICWNSATPVAFEYEVTQNAEPPTVYSKKGVTGSTFAVPITEQLWLHINVTDEKVDLYKTSLGVYMEDWARNKGGMTVGFTEYSLDEVAPTLSLTSASTKYTADSATFAATVGITERSPDATVEYQWVESGADPNPEWTTGTADLNILTVSESHTEETVVRRDLLVQAQDVAGNLSEMGRYPFSADLTKAITRYEISSDLSVPNAKPEITISRPEEGYTTRAALTFKNSGVKYITIISPSEEGDTVSLFPLTGTWYKAAIYGDGRYNTVEKATAEDLAAGNAIYGPVTVELASAKGDLTPVNGVPFVPTEGEIASTYAAETPLTVLFAPATEFHHNVEFSPATTGDGTGLTSIGYNYLINDDMIGVRIPFTVTNREQPDWGIGDVDLEKSYAVLYKADNKGQGGNEVTARMPLNSGTNQTFSVPAADKNGNAFETGAYRLEVVVAQKGGGAPLTVKYEACLLLDATKMPENIGLHEVKSNTALNSGPTFPKIQSSEIPISMANIGLAPKGELEGDSTVEERWSANATGYGLDAILTFSVGTDLKSTWILDTKIGGVVGFRAWNKESPGYEELPFSSEVSLGSLGDGRRYYLVPQNLRDEESLKTTQAQDHMLYIKEGANTVCFQVMLDNNRLSPIYETTINISTARPTLELSYQPGPSFPVTDRRGEVWNATSYVDVRIDNASAPSGGLTLYAYEREGERVWKPMEAENGAYRLTQKSIGNATTSDTKYLFAAVDSYGNATMVIPQMKVNDAPRTKWGILPTAATAEVYNPEISEGSYDVTAKLTNTSSVLVSLDGGAPITLNLEERPGNTVANSAGLYRWNYTLGFTPEIPYNGTLNMTLAIPYDATKAEGENVEHTLYLTAIGILGDLTKVEVPITVENHRPAPVKVTAAEHHVSVEFNTLVRWGASKWYSSSVDDLPIFTDGTYPITYEDLFYNTYTDTVVVTGMETDPQITLSETTITDQDVTVTITSELYDMQLSAQGGKATITGNGTKSITAVVRENDYLILTYTKDGMPQSAYLSISNIDKTKIQPRVLWSVTAEDLAKEELVGPVTATLVDNRENGGPLYDAMGNIPTYTFYPDGETSYTFTGYRNRLGQTGADFTVELPVKLVDYPQPQEFVDTTAPTVGVRGSTVINGVPTGKTIKLMLGDNQDNPALYGYDGEDVCSDESAFLSAMGWARTYVLSVEAADRSNIRLILKKGLNAETPGYMDASETVEGVKLIGRTAEVAENAAFTLFAVDSAGNATAVSLNVTALGDVPTPSLVKVPDSSRTSVRAYLLPPEGGEGSASMTDSAAKILNDPASVYNNHYYMEYTANGSYTVAYEMTYKGQTFTGMLPITVTEVDTSVPVVKSTKWSANKLLAATKGPVTVQLEFDKEIVRVSEASGQNSGVQVSAAGTRATVIYAENTAAIRLTFAARNGKSVVVDLDKVENIDTTPPVVTAGTPVLAANGRSATVTFTANEPVTLPEGGQPGTTFVKTLNQDGGHTYRFADKAGNQVAVSVSVTGIVNTPLTLSYNTIEGDTGTTGKPEELTLEVGDTIYVKANRTCKIELNGGTPKDYTTSWLAFTVTEDAKGLFPYVKAVDSYGNTTYGQLTQIAPPDRTPPTLRMAESTVLAPMAKADDELKQLLLDNVTVSDDKSAQGDITVTAVFTRPQTTGTAPVTYAATDKAGNVTTKTGYLRLYGDYELRVTVNGQMVEDSDISVVLPKSVSIGVNGAGIYSITWRKGYKTVGQMKIGATDLARDKRGDGVTTFIPDGTGYYTLLVTTQNRENYLLVLYVN